MKASLLAISISSVLAAPVFASTPQVDVALANQQTLQLIGGQMNAIDASVQYKLNEQYANATPGTTATVDDVTYEKQSNGTWAAVGAASAALVAGLLSSSSSSSDDGNTIPELPVTTSMDSIGTWKVADNDSGYLVLIAGQEVYVDASNVTLNNDGTATIVVNDRKLTLGVNGDELYRVDQVSHPQLDAPTFDLPQIDTQYQFHNADGVIVITHSHNSEFVAKIEGNADGTATITNAKGQTIDFSKSDINDKIVDKGNDMPQLDAPTFDLPQIDTQYQFHNADGVIVITHSHNSEFVAKIEGNGNGTATITNAKGQTIYFSKSDINDKIVDKGNDMPQLDAPTFDLPQIDTQYQFHNADGVIVITHSHNSEFVAKIEGNGDGTATITNAKGQTIDFSKSDINDKIVDKGNDMPQLDAPTFDLPQIDTQYQFHNADGVIVITHSHNSEFVAKIEGNGDGTATITNAKGQTIDFSKSDINDKIVDKGNDMPQLDAPTFDLPQIDTQYQFHNADGVIVITHSHNSEFVAKIEGNGDGTATITNAKGQTIDFSKSDINDKIVDKGNDMPQLDAPTFDLPQIDTQYQFHNADGVIVITHSHNSEFVAKIEGNGNGTATITNAKGQTIDFNKSDINDKIVDKGNIDRSKLQSIDQTKLQKAKSKIQQRLRG